MNLPAFEVCNIGVIPVALNDASDISDVVGEAGQNEVRVVVGRGGSLQRPSQDVVTDQRNQHGVFYIVIECIAIPNALQRRPCNSFVKSECEERNRPSVSRDRNEPRACAVSCGIVIISAPSPVQLWFAP